MVEFNKDNENSWMGTFSDHIIKIDEVEWKTAEHYIQAQRYIHFPQIYDDIKTAKTKESAYSIAKAMISLTEGSWFSHRQIIMEKIMRSKFDQHEELKQKLIDTHEESLYSTATNSSFWSMGSDRQGQNILGKLLMILRREFKGSPV